MTVPSETSRVDYVGNGTTDTYSYTFPIFADSDLLVVQADASGNESDLVLDVDYSVTGAGLAAGGSVVLAAGDLPANYTLTIRRSLPLTQLTDIKNQGAYYASIHERTFDRCRMINQQQQDEIDRCVKLPDSIPATEFDPTLPGNTAASPLKLLQINASGDGLQLTAVDAITVTVTVPEGLLAARPASLAASGFYFAKDAEQMFFYSVAKGKWYSAF